jgi:hypothetical protein
MLLLFYYYFCSWRFKPSGLFFFRNIQKLWILEPVGRTFWTGDQPVNKIFTYTGQHKQKDADTHPLLKWDRTHDPSVGASEGSISCRRRHSRCDRHPSYQKPKISLPLLQHPVSGFHLVLRKTSDGVPKFCHVFVECDYRRVLDSWPNLLGSLLQRVTTLYSSLLHTHTHTSVHSHVFTTVAW